jgi:hypothetical protein
MSLDIGVGKSLDDPALFKNGHVAFEDEMILEKLDLGHKLLKDVDIYGHGYFWFLYRYFESANLHPADKLPPDDSLIDPYCDNAIEGYQMERLEEELNVARKDIQWRDEIWEVRAGWNGKHKSKETEIRKQVSKTQMCELIDKLLLLISEAKRTNQKLVCVGD